MGQVQLSACHLVKLSLYLQFTFILRVRSIAIAILLVLCCWTFWFSEAGPSDLSSSCCRVKYSCCSHPFPSPAQSQSVFYYVNLLMKLFVNELQRVEAWKVMLLSVL